MFGAPQTSVPQMTAYAPQAAVPQMTTAVPQYAQGFGTTTMAAPQMTMAAPQMNQQSLSYVPQGAVPAMAPSPSQQQFASPRAFGFGGGSGTYAVGGGSGRFPVTTAGVPTWTPPAMTTMSPGPSYTAPGMAPGANYTGGSYTTAPALPVGVGSIGPNLIGNMGNRGGPPVSTQGMPTPPQIMAQQTQYAAALDQQLAIGIATLEKERDLEKQMLKFTCEKDIALFTNAATERYVEAAELVDEKMTFQILEYKKAMVERKLQLSAQANGLKLDYEMKSVQMEWQKKWSAFEAAFANAEKPLEEAFAKQVALANTGTAAPGVGEYGISPATLMHQ